ncbi:MAG TPA: FecR domain-containing protein [Opitutus sp.]|nr:FecR domain-containing protein [Opitutus sp.]
MAHNSQPPFFRSPDSSESRAVQATRWLVRKDRGLDAAESQAFIAWLGADPRNAAEYERAAQCWTRLDRIEEIGALSREADLLLLRRRAEGQRVHRRRWAMAGLSAAALVALAWAISTHRKMPAPENVAAAAPVYRVLESTARRLALPDGSIVELNGESEIAVGFTAGERRVQLTNGEAYFLVAKEPARPFVVAANGVTVRAVGTAFNVRMDTRRIEVLVTEGEVVLGGAEVNASDGAAAPAAPSLGAGGRAVWDTANPAAGFAIAAADTREIDQLLAWQTTRLEFDNAPLTEVVAAFNRYNGRRLVLGAPELRTLRLSGAFNAENLDGFVRLLQMTSDVIANQDSPREIVLLPRRE